MPTTEWLNKYEAIKDKLTYKDDLEAHFTEKVIGNMAVDVLDIGTVHFPTGQIFACDPLVELEDTLPFLQTIPAGTYPVKICVVPSEQYGDRYACVKVEVNQEKPVRYELGMVGNEDLDEELGEDEYFGFGVDAGMGCVADIQTQAASISKLSHIQIDHTAVTYEGLLAIAGNNRIEPVAHVQFTQEQMEHFFQLQREKAKKPVQLDEQAAAECRRVLSAFFAEMTQWEQYMEQAGFEGAEAVPRLLTIWEKYVSEKPRPGYRPLGLSYSAQGTYNGEEFLDAEQITKNKLYIYTREKNTGFDRRFLMKRVGEGWKIDAVQERLNGWQRTEV